MNEHNGNKGNAGTILLIFHNEAKSTGENQTIQVPEIFLEQLLH